MPEQLLNGTQVGALTQQVSAESMAQSMRMNVRRKSLGHANLLYDPGNAPCSKWTTSLVNKEPALGFSSLRQDFSPDFQIALQGLLCFAFQRDISLLLAFAANQH